MALKVYSLDPHEQPAFPIEKTFFTNEGQLWKLNGSMVTNMANLWNSNNDWALNARGEMFYIENTLTNKVLSIKNDEIYEENLDQNANSQLWQKVMIYYDSGYFLLRYPNSQ